MKDTIDIHKGSIKNLTMSGQEFLKAYTLAICDNETERLKITSDKISVTEGVTGYWLAGRKKELEKEITYWMEQREGRRSRKSHTKFIRRLT